MNRVHGSLVITEKKALGNLKKAEETFKIKQKKNFWNI